MLLNMEQRKIINNTVMGHSVLKGVAGSGKTTVAISRIPFLLNNYCMEESDRILMERKNRSVSGPSVVHQGADGEPCDAYPGESGV
ncbi:hypothetical protein [Parasporobacterium paucivorans]|uniref:DNA helicase n=1 Tax=Parasporobacterium paucivorans DSM 15970 TaxID=1122934 RepID=A0A1M6J7E6_9FIRM|nr:hypothetical protein [Parasporobacterium paucivorans]SHJ42580.1 hypothetical protein SAMN02745691_01925 [Parasporobacterium paucivorans DSM 15970]